MIDMVGDDNQMFGKTRATMPDTAASEFEQQAETSEEKSPMQCKVENRKSFYSKQQKPFVRADFTAGTKIGDGAYGTVFKV